MYKCVRYKNPKFLSKREYSSINDKVTSVDKGYKSRYKVSMSSTISNFAILVLFISILPIINKFLLASIANSSFWCDSYFPASKVKVQKISQLHQISHSKYRYHLNNLLIDFSKLRDCYCKSKYNRSS